MNAVYQKVQNIISQKYILPFQEKENAKTPAYVGIELEFPLGNLAKKPVSVSFADAVMRRLIAGPFQFQADTYDKSGVIAGVANHTDLIAFDNSYNNIEFSMGKDTCIHSIAQRFYRYLSYILDFITPHQYTIIGTGTNPYKPYIQDSPVSIPLYDTIQGYLRFVNKQAEDEKISSAGFHEYVYFPPYLSSVQTHIDARYSQLCDGLNLFSSLDFVRAILFSNSPPFYTDTEDVFSPFHGTVNPAIQSETTAKQNILCFRDYLWEKGGFSLNPHNVGKIDTVFQSPEDIIDDYMQRSIFFRKKIAARSSASSFPTQAVNDKYEYFLPVPLYQYFTDPKYQAVDSDIFTFISFRTIELTFRGTLEIRSDCAQPLQEAFAPSAFSFGLSKRIKQALALIYDFKKEHLLSLSNSELRNLATSDILPAQVRTKISSHLQAAFDSEAPTKIPDVSARDLQAFIFNLLDLAKEGLQSNHPEDAAYLLPLYKRAETLRCPAI